VRSAPIILAKGVIMRGFFISLIKHLHRKNKISKRCGSVRLLVEQLEDRTVLSPVLVSPTVSSNTNPTFTWDPVSGATSYDFSLTDQTSGLTVVTQSNITTTSFNLPLGDFPLAQTDTYAWTARADNGGGPIGAYSTPLTFIPDASLQNPNWATELGSYTFSNNNTTAVGHSTQNTAVLADVNLADISVQAHVTFTAAGQSAGLVARYDGTGDTNMYFGRLIYSGSNTVNAAIYRNVNGTWSQIGVSKNVSGPGGALVFEVQGSDLKLFLNGAVVAYGYDSTFTTGTVGIRSSVNVTLSSFQANLDSSVNASLPFNDTFGTGSFGNQLSNSWSERAGNFNISTGAAVSQGTTLGLATVNGINAADVNVQGSVNFTAAGQYAGLIARHSGTGDTNMYYGRLLYLGNGVVNAGIFRNLNGTWTQVGGGDNLDATSGTLGFKVVGNQLQLFLNGNVIASGVDSTFATGAVGIRAAGTGIGNFQSAAASNSSSWITQAGAISLVSGTAFTQPGSGGIATYAGSTSGDVTVQGFVTFNATNQYAGLVARYSGSGDKNMYFGRLSYLGNGVVNAAIFRNLNGTWTQIGVSTNVAASGGSLIFQVEGTNLKLFLNGVVVAYGNDTALTSGAVGIRAFGGATVGSFGYGAPTLISNTAPFGDNFVTPSQGNQLSYSWEEQAGNFNLGTGAAVGQSSTNLATVNGLTETNTTVQADVTLSAVGQYAGLVARYSNPQSPNMYYASATALANGQFRFAIYRSLHGSWTQLTATTLSSFSGALQFKVTGSSLILSVDGVQRLSTTDSVINVPGLVGIRGSLGASYNSFAAS
jgi:hypothetical protein